MCCWRQLHSVTLSALASSLLFLQALGSAQIASTLSAPPQAATFRIAGTARSTVDGHSLAGTRVSITDTRNDHNQQSMITGKDGHFEFNQVSAGKYSLQGAKRGYITAAYDAHEQFSTAIVTSARFDTENLILRLAPAALLSGHVLDESGDPVRQAAVTLWRDDHSSGISRIVRVRNDNTDDQGSYEFTPLDAGSYFLSASAKPWYAVHPASSGQGREGQPAVVDPSLDVVYPTTYYAGATEAEDATPIPVRGGDRIEIDVHLIPVPALHILFRTDENGEHGFHVPMFQKRIFDGVDFGQNGEARMVSPGILEMTMAPGRYAVRLPGQSSGRDIQANEIDVTQDNQELDFSSGESLSNVIASVQVQGETKLPQRLAVGLRNGQRTPVVWQLVSEKGEVTLHDVAPGKYDVLAGSAAKAFSVIRVSTNGVATSGHLLDIPPGSSLTVSLLLVGGSASVEGFVKRAGVAAPGAMVVLIPKHPESNRELFRRDQSDLDGSFTLQSVIPGSYTVVAIENGWDLDWANPAVIANYARHGQTLIIADGTNSSVRLPKPIELQTK